VADERQYLLKGETLQEWVRSARPHEECRFDPDDSGLYWAAGLCVPLMLALGILLLAFEISKKPDSPRAPKAIPTATAPRRFLPGTAIPSPELGMDLVPLRAAGPEPAAEQALPYFPVLGWDPHGCSNLGLRSAGTFPWREDP
jgi:hypothetical protein